ncbi:ADP-ribosylation factor-like protein 6 [Sycon ciliatum]|uniref:ADP-ribosylation factor-like protein 6 n=1 Tax=Sycon ciliatum TaxID=27933 RepID=UPI0020A8C907|eukprot:scpid43970/ scgid24040/ ADP-ribosylation factor-like protein 6; Bardet-Biedl syndrome 3 protein
MGIMDALGKLFGWNKRKAEVLCVGLDNSGKSTIVNQLKPDKAQLDNIVPTIGFKVEQFTASGVTFTVFDMAGQSRYRVVWERYYKTVKGIIFVVDSSERLRMATAKDELERLLTHKDVVDRHIPLLIFANKMDVHDSISAIECSEELGLSEIKTKPWNIFASNALTGEGLSDGIEWLSDALQQTM